MAHVAVVRRSMRPEEWTALRYSWLKRGVIADREEIVSWRIRDARQISENEYEYRDGPERDLRRGICISRRTEPPFSGRRRRFRSVSAGRRCTFTCIPPRR